MLIFIPEILSSFVAKSRLAFACDLSLSSNGFKTIRVGVSLSENIDQNIDKTSISIDLLSKSFLREFPLFSSNFQLQIFANN